MEVESTLLSSDISDLVPLEPDNDDKVLSVLLLLLLLFPSLKLESSSPQLLLTSSSSNAEAHMAKMNTLLALKDRVPLAK